MTIQELNKQISAGSISGCYLFYGKEWFLIEDKIAKMKAKCVEMPEFNYFVFSEQKPKAGSGSGYIEIEDALTGVPLMSGKKMVVVKNAGVFGSADCGDFMLRMIEKLPEYTVLVIVEDSADRRKKIFTQLSDVSSAVEFKYQDKAALEIWAERVLEKADKRMLTRDLQYFISVCPEDMSSVNNEIQKLLLFAESRDSITREDIDAVVVKSMEYNVFDVFGCIMAREADRAFAILNDMEVHRSQSGEVLAAVLNTLSRLLMVKQLSADGYKEADMKQFFEGSKEAYIRVLLGQARSFSEAALKRALTRGLQLDVDIKQGRMDGWAAVNMFVSGLLGGNK